MALMNAGIPLSGMAGAVSCFLLQDGAISFDASTCSDMVWCFSFIFIHFITHVTLSSGAVGRS